MQDPRNERSRPEIKCKECNGTGYQDFICNHCRYDMENDFDADPNSINSYGSDDACPNCRRNDALTICDSCKGDGKKEMDEDEFYDYEFNMRYGHYEKI